MRNTSTWSEFVSNANFTNVNETEAIQELVDQITELKAILNHLNELNVSCILLFHQHKYLSKNLYTIKQNLFRIAFLQALNSIVLYNLNHY